MSKLKTPREKKLASLALDSRNVYGNNDKAGRKGIPKGKRRGHKAVRRAAVELLHSISAAMDEDEIVSAEATVHSRAVQSKLSSFKKEPDAPLGNLLEHRKMRNRKLLSRKFS